MNLDREVVNRKRLAQCLFAVQRTDLLVAHAEMQVLAQAKDLQLQVLTDAAGHRIALRLFKEHVSENDYSLFTRFLHDLDDMLVNKGGKPIDPDPPEKEEGNYEGPEEAPGWGPIGPLPPLPELEPPQIDQAEMARLERELAESIAKPPTPAPFVSYPNYPITTTTVIVDPKQWEELVKQQSFYPNHLLTGVSITPTQYSASGALLQNGYHPPIIINNNYTGSKEPEKPASQS